MFSLKVKSLAWKGNELRYILVAGAVVFVTLFGVLGIAGTVILYITLSFLTKEGKQEFVSLCLCNKPTK